MRYARPFPMNRIPFPPWPVEHKAVSSVLRYARPRFHRLFRPSRLAPDEHDDDAVSPFRPSHVHEPWPYVCASRHSRPCSYVRTWPCFISCTLAAVRTCTCYMCASTMTRARSTSTSMYVHVCHQNDNTTYASTRWVPTVRHFLACEDIAGGSQQSGERIVFFPYALPCV